MTRPAYHNTHGYLKTPSDVWLLLRVALWLMIVIALLRTTRLPRLLKLIEPRPVSGLDAAQMIRVRAYTDFLVRRLMRSKTPCLHRSLVLYRFLRAMGVGVQIVFAVRKNGAKLEGHAWLDYQNRPFLDHTSPQGTYQIIFRHPALP